ncbi:MAG: desulfoferrodoxin family protein [Candidatus Aminicenantes bacterium]|nr:desulfoferrodoxin family protein [Candidatus Aminicenantes bacterium]
MADLKELIQSADWRREKHVPVIEFPTKAVKGEIVQVKVSIGKEITHPNKTEHHISRIDIYFLPVGEKFAHQIGTAEFSAHGASTQGPDTSTIYTHHEVVMSFKTDKPGTLFATSLCNIHGLWQNSQPLELETTYAALPSPLV